MATKKAALEWFFVPDQAKTPGFIRTTSMEDNCLGLGMGLGDKPDVGSANGLAVGRDDLTRDDLLILDRGAGRSRPGRHQEDEAQEGKRCQGQGSGQSHVPALPRRVRLPGSAGSGPTTSRLAPMGPATSCLPACSPGP